MAPPTAANQPHRVFCGSLCDVFEARDDVVAARVRLFDLIRATPHLTWLLLTKRPTSIAEILHYGDPRPRTVTTLTEPTFVATKKRSLEVFQREVRR